MELRIFRRVMVERFESRLGPQTSCTSGNAPKNQANEIHPFFRPLAGIQSFDAARKSMIFGVLCEDSSSSLNGASKEVN
jgi:hypothetical protein